MKKNAIIAIIVAVVITALCFWAYKWRQDDIEHWKTAGRNELTAEIALATAQAEAETKKKQAEEKKATKKRKEVIHEKNDDRPVGPLLNRFYDSLR